jgi:HEAT repeat protein
LLEAGLDRRGQACFSFLHRSFLEYLTARALASRVAEEGWTSIADLVDRKAWHPAWQEVVLFLAGELEDPAPLLELLADESRDDYFRHRLALAARCLGELENPAFAPASLIDRITKGALFTGLEHARVGTLDVVSHLNHAFPCLAQANGRVEGLGLLDLACHWLESDAHLPEAVWVLEATGPWAARHARATSLLVSLMSNHDDLWVRWRAARALWSMGEAKDSHPEVIAALIDRLRRDPLWQVRWQAAAALQATAASMALDPDFILALAECGLHEKHAIVATKMAQALRAVGDAAIPNPAVISALIDRLLRDRDGSARVLVAQVLEKWGKRAAVHPDVVPALLNRIELDEDWQVRKKAIEALRSMGQIAASHPGVLNVLLDQIADEKNESVRTSVSVALRTMRLEKTHDLWLAPHPPESSSQAAGALDDWEATDGSQAIDDATAQSAGTIRAIVRQLLRDEDWEVRSKAAEILGEMGETLAQYPEAVSALVNRLMGDRDWWVRAKAAEALGSLGDTAAYPEVVPALLDRLLQDAEAQVRMRVAGALGSAGAAFAPDVIAALLDRLVHDGSWEVQTLFATALRSTFERVTPSPDVLPTLMDKLEHSEDWLARQGAAYALGAMGGAMLAFPSVIPALLNRLLQEENRWVRGAVGTAIRDAASRGARVFRAEDGQWLVRTIDALSGNPDM